MLKSPCRHSHCRDRDLVDRYNNNIMRLTNEVASHPNIFLTQVITQCSIKYMHNNYNSSRADYPRTVLVCLKNPNSGLILHLDLLNAMNKVYIILTGDDQCAEEVGCGRHGSNIRETGNQCCGGGAHCLKRHTDTHDHEGIKGVQDQTRQCCRQHVGHCPHRDYGCYGF